MINTKFMNPSKMLADTLSHLHTNNLTMMPTSGLKKEEREQVEKESKKLFDDVKNGNLDFITNILSAHAIILDNITYVCNKKAKNGEHFKEYTELSIKASDQLRKSGLALGQIKNIILNFENLTIQQQNNLLQLNEAGKKLCNSSPIPEVSDVKKLV